MATGRGIGEIGIEVRLQDNIVVTGITSDDIGLVWQFVIRRREICGIPRHAFGNADIV